MITEIKVGDIVKINLEPVVGDEKNNHSPVGRHCLVIVPKIAGLNLITVLPITDADGKSGKKLFVDINDTQLAGLDKASVIDCLQIRSVSTQRLIQKSPELYVYGKVSKRELFEIRKKMAIIYGIDEAHL